MLKGRDVIRWEREGKRIIEIMNEWIWMIKGGDNVMDNKNKSKIKDVDVVISFFFLESQSDNNDNE